MNIKYRSKRTISVKMFISEFGGEFSEHVKTRLMELEARCFLKRDEVDYIFDLKHVEHLKYECDGSDTSKKNQKEYAYAQLAALEGGIYFSESCKENNETIQAPIVNTIYRNLSDDGSVFIEGRNLKKIDDNNIDYVVETLLSSCPQVSQGYLDIVKGMVSRASN